jgi:hypothetical protein
MSDDIIGDLFEAKKYLDSLGPYPRAIWLVDRPQFYERLKQMLPEKAFQTTDVLPVDMLPIYVIDSRESHQHFPRRPPWFASIPGLWVEMSNGKHRRYEVEE